MEVSNPTPLPTDGIKKVGNKHFAIVLLAAFGLFLCGILFYLLGYFDNPVSKNSQDSLVELAPPTSKNTPLTDDKYKNSNEIIEDELENGTEDLTLITGKASRYKKESNETLTEADFEEIRQNRNAVNYPSSIPKTAAQRKKEQENKLFLENQRKEIARQKVLLNTQTPIFHKTNEELADEHLDKEERELNQRTANLVLSNLEKMSSPSVRNEAVVQQNEKKANSSLSLDETVEIHPEVTQNTMGMKWKKSGFYGFSASKKSTFYTDNDAVLAVIHGQSEGIEVRDGTSIKLRLIQNTVLQIGDNQVVFKEGTLLPASCKITEDRVFISIKSLRIANAIYPINISVYDLDGQQGLFVPHLKEKNVLSKEIADAATRPFSGTSVFVPSGSVANQVGTQMALQSTQTLMQGAKGYVRSKAQSPKVTIKANYKVLLKSISFRNGDEN